MGTQQRTNALEVQGVPAPPATRQRLPRILDLDSEVGEQVFTSCLDCMPIQRLCFRSQVKGLYLGKSYNMQTKFGNQALIRMLMLRWVRIYPVTKKILLDYKSYSTTTVPSNNGRAEASRSS